jgi:hypothetical protein
LAVVVVGVGDAKLGQTQSRGFAGPRSLQHVFRRQCGSGAVAERKGVAVVVVAASVTERTDAHRAAIFC